MAPEIASNLIMDVILMQNLDVFIGYLLLVVSVSQ